MSAHSMQWVGWKILALLAMISPGVAGAVEPTKAKVASTPWAIKMRGLEQTLQDLLIDLSSDERFNAPKNFHRIEKNAEKFAKLAHELKLKDGTAPDSDPTLQIIAGQFSKEADEAYRTLKGGHRAYARDLLKSMTGYCMACHTRNSSGPSFEGMANSPAMASLNTLEKADLFASTRQFDQALQEYEKLLSDPSTIDRRTFDWERAIRSSLAISVRVKKDPERALGIVDRVMATPKAPFYLKEQAAQWKLSLNEWKKEGTVKAQTEQGYYAQAVKLLGDARSMQKYPADRSADILYLRASSAVHDLLSFAPNGEHATDALYIAGLCYEVLRDLNLWDQHEFYYLACIIRSPHTEKAQQCFRQYEQSVYRGYTGTGGTQLPADVREKLKELGQLSTPSR